MFGMLVMNETLVAENIIKEKTVGAKPMQDIALLARYYCTKIKENGENVSVDKVVDILLPYLESQYDDYQSFKWRSRVEQCVKKMKNIPICDIDSIPITQNELDIIRNINNKKLEKLAFTCLVIAKYYNLRNSSNNGYVNVDYSVIFKSARVTATTYEQPLLLNDLKQLGLVQRCKRVDNPNFRVLFVDDASETVLKIKDLRELGYAYLEYRGESFIRCAGCGILMRKKSNAMKYCKSCRCSTMGTRVVVCEDCGKEFVVNSKNNMTHKCESCYEKYRKEYKNTKEKERYQKLILDRTK